MSTTVPKITVRWWSARPRFDADLVRRHAPEVYERHEEGEAEPVITDVQVIDALMRAQFNREDGAKKPEKRWSEEAKREVAWVVRYLKLDEEETEKGSPQKNAKDTKGVEERSGTLQDFRP